MFFKAGGKVKLIKLPPSGLVSNEDESGHVDANQFLWKVGTVLEEDDTAYDCERPTGYEPINALVDFDGQRVWIPWECYCGYTEHKEIWHKYLKRVKE